MSYINTTTNQYPISEQEIRNLFPNTSFPSIFSPPEEYTFVFPTPVPSYNVLTQYYREIAPVFTEISVWEQRWEVVDLDPAQIVINQENNNIQIKTSIEQQTQQRLDEFAKTRGYDGIMSCCTYAISPNLQFKAEAEYCIIARDTTWTIIYEIFTDVDNEVRTMPTGFAAIESELPILAWPV